MSNLLNYETGQVIRPATDAEIVESRSGVIRVDVEGVAVTAYAENVGRYIMIEDQQHYVDTDPEYVEAERALADAGIESAPVYIGEGHFVLKTNRIVFAAE